MAAPLSRLECRTKPLRDGDYGLLARYDALFAASRVTLRDLTAAVVDGATHLRAKYAFKSPDALHLAAHEPLALPRIYRGTCGGPR